MSRDVWSTPDATPACESGIDSIPAVFERLYAKPWPTPAISRPTTTRPMPESTPSAAKQARPMAISPMPSDMSTCAPYLATSRPPIGDITTSGMLKVRKTMPASTGSSARTFCR